MVNEVTTYFMRRGTAVNACLLDCSKAFDKCRFDKLFEKLIAKGFPPIVVRILIFAYEEQTGCVKLAGKQSTFFKLTNGTRQGSVLSPILFSVYLDDIVGYIFVLFILTVAATESSIGLSILSAYYKLKQTIQMEKVKNIKS